MSTLGHLFPNGLPLPALPHHVHPHCARTALSRLHHIAGRTALRSCPLMADARCRRAPPLRTWQERSIVGPRCFDSRSLTISFPVFFRWSFCCNSAGCETEFAAIWCWYVFLYHRVRSFSVPREPWVCSTDFVFFVPWERTLCITTRKTTVGRGTPTEIREVHGA